jgi:hypothetical protein
MNERTAVPLLGFCIDRDGYSLHGIGEDCARCGFGISASAPHRRLLRPEPAESDAHFLERIADEADNARHAYYEERGRGILESLDDVVRLLELAQRGRNA